MVGPGQVIIDLNPKEPEAADSLHRSPVDGEGGEFYSLSLPLVHDQLLCFADVEIEIVVLAPRCQGSDLLSVVAGDQAYDGREDVVLPIRTTCGLPVRKFRIQSQRAMLSPRSLSLVMSFRGTMVLNAEL